MASDNSAGNGKKLDHERKKKFFCKHCLQDLSKRQFQRHKRKYIENDNTTSDNSLSGNGLVSTMLLELVL